MTTVVIGYGNTLRGDDAAGSEVALALAALDLPDVRAVAVPQLTPELAEVLAESELAVFVDASLVPEAVGVEALPLAPAQRMGSLGHACDPGVLLALASAIYGRHPRAWMIRIPAMSFELGDDLSPCTARGTQAALHEVLRLLAFDDNTADESSAAAHLPQEDGP